MPGIGSDDAKRLDGGREQDAAFDAAEGAAGQLFPAVFSKPARARRRCGQTARALDELSRAGRQAAWTKQHPGRDKSENPYLREKIYQSTDLDRAKNFEAWAKAHPNEPHS